MLIKTMLITLISVLFLIQSHPLWLSIYVILAMLIASISMFDFSSFHWFSYILCMIFLGGLLILFVYISSLVPSAPISSTQLWGSIPTVAIISSIYFTFKPLSFNSTLSSLPSFSISNMLQHKTELIFVVIGFLSLMLVIVSIFSSSMKFPLRKL